jgi:hypothetical protein
MLRVQEFLTALMENVLNILNVISSSVDVKLIFFIFKNPFLPSFICPHQTPDHLLLGRLTNEGLANSHGDAP